MTFPIFTGAVSQIGNEGVKAVGEFLEDNGIPVNIFPSFSQRGLYHINTKRREIMMMPDDSDVLKVYGRTGKVLLCEISLREPDSLNRLLEVLSEGS